MQGKVLAFLLLSMLVNVRELQAWRMPSFLPKIAAIKGCVSTLGSRFIQSGYGQALTCLATGVASLYTGYKIAGLFFGNSSSDKKKMPLKVEKRKLVESKHSFQAIKLGNGEGVQGKAILLPSVLPGRSVLVQQVDVLNQFIPGNGGYGSCGYQALKNACGIVSKLSRPDNPEGQALLAGREQANRLFGFAEQGTAAGDWRARIIESREKIAIEQSIRRQFAMQVINARLDSGLFKSEKIQEVYRGLRDDFIRELVRRLFEGGESSVELNQEAFIAWVTARDINIADPIEYRDNDGELGPLVAHIKNPVTIGAYVHIEPRRFVRDAGNRDHGEWLRSGEIESLIAHVKQAPATAHLRDVPMVVLDSVQREHLQAIEQEELIPEVGALRTAITNNRPLPHPVYAFVLGTMRYSGMTGADGHWITLVVDSPEGNQRRYTLADSAGNRVRLHDGPAYNLIRYLEGDRIASDLRNFREPGFCGWFDYHIWRPMANLL